MSINFTTSDYNLNVIKANDSYDVFKDNLEALEVLLCSDNESEGNEEVREIKISIMRYAKGYPLDFNSMIATESGDNSYLLEFDRYKLVKCLPISVDDIE